MAWTVNQAPMVKTVRKVRPDNQARWAPLVNEGQRACQGQPENAALKVLPDRLDQPAHPVRKA